MYVRFVSSVNYKDLLSAIVLIMPLTGKLSSGSFKYALISVFALQTPKPSRTKAGLSSSMSSSTWNSTEDIWVLNLYATNQTKLNQEVKCSSGMLSERMNKNHTNLRSSHFEIFSDGSAKCWSNCIPGQQWDSCPEMMVIFRLHLIFIADLQHVRHLSLRQIHSSDVTDSWGGSCWLLYYVLNAKFLGASEQAALFRQQTNRLVRGSENNAIYFSFLLAIFHSYVMCVLQSSGPARRQEAAASSHLM